MFCTNCGEQLEEGTRFCTKCGARVETEPSGAGSQENGQARQSIGSQENGQTQQSAFSQAQEPENIYSGGGAAAAAGARRSRLPIIIAIAAVVIVAGVLSVMAITGNSSKSGSMTPEEYFAYIETNALEKAAGASSETYRNCYDYVHGSASNSQSISMNIGEELYNLLNAYTGVDFSWLNTISLNMDSSFSDNGIAAKGNIGINGSDIADFDTVISMADQAMFIHMPSMSENFLAFPLTGGISPSSFAGIADFFPDQQSISGIIKRYGSVIINNIKDVERSTENMSVGDVSQNCTKLTAYIDMNTLRRISGDIASEIKNDSELAGVIDSLIAAAGQSDSYTAADITEAVSNLLEEFSKNSGEYNDSDKSQGGTNGEDFQIVYTVYTDSSDEIAGTESGIKNADGAYMRIFSCLAPVSGNKSALDCTIAIDSASVSLTGTGNGSRSSHSGTYTVSFNSDDMFTIIVDNYDIGALDRGEINGSFTVYPAEGAMDAIRNSSSELSSMARLIGDYGLRFDITSSGADSNCTVGIIDAKGSQLLSFDIKNSFTGGGSVKQELPTASDSVYNAADSGQTSQYLTGLNFDTLINGLKQANVPSEYTDLLSAYASQISQLAA